MNFFSGFVAHVCICIGLLDLSVQLPNTYLHKHAYYYIIIFFWIFSPKNSIFHDTFTISFDTNTGKYYIMINVIYIIIAYIVLF